jgi:hypothetical protein
MKGDAIACAIQTSAAPMSGKNARLRLSAPKRSA